MAAAVALLVAATVFAARTGVADYWAGVASSQLDSPGVTADIQAARSQLRRAIRARPGVASYWRELAAVESNDDPNAALRDIRKALRLNSQPAGTWYELGMIEFQLGDSRAALDALREAAQHDPQGEHVHFEFAGLARALGEQKLFRAQLKATAAVMEPNFVGQVLNAAAADGYSPADIGALLPRNNALNLAVGVHYFAGRGDWNEATSVFLGVGHCVGPLAARDCRAAAVELLSGLGTKAKSGRTQMRAQALDWAREVWNHALRVGIVSGTPAEIGKLQDGGFRYPWLGTLFSWRDTHILPAVVEAAAGPDGGNAVRFDFSGVDSQQGGLLEQDVWVKPGQPYVVALVSRDAAAPQESGVSAIIVTASGDILAQAVLPLLPQWSSSRLAFSVPADVSVITLQFRYIRPNGQTLLHSEAEIAAVTMVLGEGRR